MTLINDSGNTIAVEARLVALEAWKTAKDLVLTDILASIDQVLQVDPGQITNTENRVTALEAECIAIRALITTLQNGDVNDVKTRMTAAEAAIAAM